MMRTTKNPNDLDNLFPSTISSSSSRSASSGTYGSSVTVLGVILFPIVCSFDGENKWSIFFLANLYTNSFSSIPCTICSSPFLINGLNSFSLVSLASGTLDEHTTTVQLTPNTNWIAYCLIKKKKESRKRERERVLLVVSRHGKNH